MSAPTAKRFLVDWNQNGQYEDISEDVASATFRHGSVAKRAFGRVYTPASGSITLRNRHGKYRSYAPDAGIVTAPGPIVRIETVDGAPLFYGWSEGLHDILPNDLSFQSVMPIVGPLLRINDYHQRLFAVLDGVLLSDEVLHAMLNDVGWKGGRKIQRGLTKIQTFRLKSRGTTSSSDRQRRPFLDACKVIAEAEIGRIYDDRNGNIVFENRAHRASYLNLPTKSLDDSSGFVVIGKADVGKITDSIVNVVSGKYDSFKSIGEQKVPFSETMPYTITIPPYRTEGHTFTVNEGSDAQFVQSWKPLIRDKHFSYSGPYDTKKWQLLNNFTRNTYQILMRNLTNETQTLIIHYIEGELFQEAGSRDLTEQHYRSVDIYGERATTYPVDLLPDVEDVRSHLEAMVEIHSGIDRFGSQDIDPFRQLNLRLKLNEHNSADWMINDISDLILLTLEPAGLVNQPFFVDEVIHDIPEFHGHTITLRLTDARKTLFWSASQMNFEFNTIIAP